MRTSLLGLTSAAFVFGLAPVGCHTVDDSLPPPPAPMTISATVGTASAALQPPLALLSAERVPPMEDVAPDARKLGGRSADVVGLQACCRALQQNAVSMPPPNNAYAAAAAAACQSLVGGMASGAVTKTDAMTRIQAALKAAGMPPACR